MPTLKKKQSQNIFNTIKKIDKIAIDCKKPDQAKTFMITEFKARLNKNKAQHILNMMKDLNKMKLCLTPTSKMCKRLCGRFSERAWILEEKVMKWKLKDAYKEYNKACQEMNKRKKECNEFLSECTNIRFRKNFFNI